MQPRSDQCHRGETLKIIPDQFRQYQLSEIYNQFQQLEKEGLIQKIILRINLGNQVAITRKNESICDFILTCELLEIRGSPPFLHENHLIGTGKVSQILYSTHR